MNIGVDIRSLLEDHWSGVSWYCFNILNALFKIDKDNNYFLFYNQYKPVQKKLVDWPQDNVHYAGFNIPNKVLNLSFRFLDYPQVNKLIEKKFSHLKIDLFWLPNLNFFALSPDCSLLLTFHDASFDRYSKFLNFKQKLWHYAISPQKVCSKAQKIIAVSENTKNDLQELYNISEDKIKVIYNGVDQSCFKLISDTRALQAIRLKHNLPDRFILFVGDVLGRKNSSSLLLAYKNLKDKNLNLVIVNSDDKNSYQNYKQVMSVSRPSRNDLAVIYNLAEMLVYPSYYEGFGMPCLEAMACGCPVIASASSSLPEVVADAGLLIDPYNIMELSFAMNTVLENQELRQGMVKRGLSRACEFRWERAAGEMLKIFKGKKET